MPLEKLRIVGFQAHRDLTVELDPAITTIQGPTDCISGDTVIDDPVDGSSITVYERWRSGQLFYVRSLDLLGREITARACPPKKFGNKPMIRFTTEFGKFKVTAHHLFLDAAGHWIYAGAIGGASSVGAFHLWTNSGNSQLTQQQDARHLRQTIPNYQDYYSSDFYLGGEQLQYGLGTVPKSFPLLGDAHEHIRPLLRSGAAEARFQYTHPYLFDGRRSTSDFSRLLERSVFGELGYPLPESDFAHVCDYYQRRQQSNQGRTPFGIADKQDLSFFPSISCWAPALRVSGNNGSTIIRKIEYLASEPYYDFHVPCFENYIAAGICHHNSGKSSILRALRWLATNRPAGDAFRRADCKTTAVSLRVDGKVISRRRGKKNIYKLNEQIFAAMGNRVPDEIANLLNIGDINFAGQFDAPFWLSDSPGAVSRSLNAIVDLGIIDETLAAVAARLRKAAATVEISRERRAAAKEEREKLSWVPAFCVKLGNLERKESRIAAKHQDCRALRSLIAEVETAETTRQAVSRGNQAGLAAVATGERWATSEYLAAGLRGLIAEIEESEKVASATAWAVRLNEGKFKKQTKGQACPICQKPIQ